MTRWYCPCCGGTSTQCYRCSECGHDLAGQGATAGREEMQ
jgi:hypothetical protein